MGPRDQTRDLNNVQDATYHWVSFLYMVLWGLFFISNFCKVSVVYQYSALYETMQGLCFYLAVLAQLVECFKLRSNSCFIYVYVSYMVLMHAIFYLEPRGCPMCPHIFFVLSSISLLVFEFSLLV
jgi:uncharacterized protein YhhL (DUF1145 family)